MRTKMAFLIRLALVAVVVLALQPEPTTGANWEMIAQALDPGGQTLEDWTNANNPCADPPFTGVICTGVVPVAVDLSGRGLTGSIPDAISGLNPITALDLSNNKLSGGIPQSIAAMVALQSLDISNNVLNGQVAFDFTPMVALTQLVISHNYLSGGIPPSWGNLNRMAVLEAQSNQFQGGIPGALENMRNLMVLRLDSNQLTGTPPAGLVYLQTKPGATYNFSNQANAQAFSCQPFTLCAGTIAGGAAAPSNTPAARAPAVAPSTVPVVPPGGGAQAPSGASGGQGGDSGTPTGPPGGGNGGGGNGGGGNGTQVLPGEQGSPPGSSSNGQNGANDSTGTGAPAPGPFGDEATSGAAPPTSSSSSLPLPIIIGAAAGGVAIIAVIALIICCLCCRKKERDELPKDAMPKRTLSMTGQVKSNADIEAQGGTSLLANAAPMPGPSPEPSPVKVAAVEGAAAGAAAAAAAATVKYQQSKQNSGGAAASAENSRREASSASARSELAAKGAKVGAELRGEAFQGSSAGMNGGGSAAPVQNSALPASPPPPGYSAASPSISETSANERVILAGSAVAAGVAAVGASVAVASARRRESPKASPKDEPLWEPPQVPAAAIPAYSGSQLKQVESFSTMSSTSISEVSDAPRPKEIPPQQAVPPAPMPAQLPIRILPPQKLPPAIPEDKATTESDFAHAGLRAGEVEASDAESMMSSRDGSRSSVYERERAEAASLAAAQLVAGINAAAGTKKPGAADSVDHSTGALNGLGSGGVFGGVRREDEEDDDQQDDEGEWEASGGESLQRFFTVQELSLATNDFGRQAKRNILGTGRFGTVYKARLPDGTTVAVKRLNNQNPDQTAREFKFEAEAFVAARHPNLVGLLGCCAEEVERMLVYEFVPNGSLEQWLHTGPGAETLDWPMRMHLALGTARGLFHLHQGMEMKVVHRDVKSSNVLIDSQWNAKLGDFALAKIMGREQAVAATRVVGTFGYAAPEYMNTGLLTERSDVYSFGVLLLEIFTGRKPIDNASPDGERELVPYVQRLADEGRLMDGLDVRLQGLVPPEDVEYALGIALKCVDRNALKRPRMSQIVAMLESEDPANRTDWMPRRPSVQNTPRIRDNSPSMTPSGRDSTPSYRGAYDHPYYSPRVNNLVSPRVRDSAGGGYVSASPRVRDSTTGATYVGASPRIRDPAAGYVSYSPRVRDPAVGYSPRASGNVPGGGYVGGSPRVRDSAQYLPRAGSPRAASPTAADIITNNAMNMNTKKQWSTKR